MHELSIITSVVDSVVKVAKQNRASSVEAVNLNIGVMVDAIDDALQASFEMLAFDEPLLKNCQLNILYIEPESRCLECAKTYNHDRFNRTCKFCASDLTELVHGSEIEIDTISIRHNDSDKDNL